MSIHILLLGRLRQEDHEFRVCLGCLYTRQEPVSEHSVAGCLPSMYQTLSSSLALKAITLTHESRWKLHNLFKLHGAEAVEGKNKSIFQIAVFLTFGSPFFLMT